MTPNYKVFALPIAPNKPDIDKFSTLRLLALKMDPASFGSTYEREIAFTEDQWRARLSTHDRATFIASVVDTTVEEWVGTASILVPSDMTFESLAPLRDAGVGEGSDIYVLVGMWVHPHHRKRGLGKRLVEETFEWIRRREVGIKKRTIALQITDENEAGRVLYSRTGFHPVPEVPSDHEWMLARV